MRVVYLGFNDPRLHARGVEFVIQSQAQAATKAYYIFWGKEKSVFRWGKLICISVIKKQKLWPIHLNALIFHLTKHNNSAIIHSHNYLMSLALLRKIDITTVHDGLTYQKSAMGNNCFIWKAIESLVYKKTKTVHFISNYAKSMAYGIKYHKDTTIIHNTCPRELTNLSTKNPPQSTGPYILVVRSIEERAAIDLLIKTMVKLRENHNFSHRIIIAGKGPLLHKYREEIAISCPDEIELKGYVSDQDLTQLYLNADFTLTPALYGEGFGLPVIESYFYGKEAIASNVCALPEIIRSHDLLFNNTVNDLSQKILAVINKKTNPAECKKYYYSRFGMPQYIQKFKLVYGNLK